MSEGAVGGLTASTSAVQRCSNCCCSKGSVSYWSNPLFSIFDMQALWRSVLSARVPACQKSKIVGCTSMAKCKAVTGSAVKGLTSQSIHNRSFWRRLFALALTSKLATINRKYTNPVQTNWSQSRKSHTHKI